MIGLVFHTIGELPRIAPLDNFPEVHYEKDVALVELINSALNHRDLWIIRGMYANIKTNCILGSDGCGIYEGRDVVIHPGINWGNNEAFQSKDFRVLGMPDWGTFAEYIEIDQKYIYPKPSHLDYVQGAALPLAGLTAFRSIVRKCQPQKGEKVLITGIGGGVALFAMQFALALGCEVYVTSGSQDKIKKARKLGAVDGVNYKENEWDIRLKEMGGGFDVVIDSAGGDGFYRLINLCNPGARVCFYGGTAGKINNLSPQIIFWKQITIFGSTMGSDKDFADMLQLVNDHNITPVVDSVFKLSEFDKAIKRMENAEQFGKIVLDNKGLY